MKPPNVEGATWTGDFKEITDTEYWCPTANKWSWCPGPCPDGQEHDQVRTTSRLAKVMEAEDGVIFYQWEEVHAETAD